MDHSKYIYDPHNPQGCKIYKLLLKIVKSEKYANYLSPKFFFAIFQKIFRNDLIKGLWDAPEAHEEMSFISLLELYRKQYSHLDLIDFLHDSKFEQQILTTNTWKYLNHCLNIFEPPNQIDKNRLLDYRTLFSSSLPPFTSTIDIRKKKNLLLFLDTSYYPILQYLHPPKATILVTLQSEYENILRQGVWHDETIKPLLLKKWDDILLLLDVLFREVEYNDNTKKLITPSYLDKVSIQSYFYLQSLTLDQLGNKKEIYFVGENGDGKTLMLQAILLALKGNEKSGIIYDHLKSLNAPFKLSASDSLKNTYSYKENEKQSHYKNVFAYGVNRHQEDSDQKETFGYLTLFDQGQYLYNPVKWLQYLDHKASKQETDALPISIAKALIKEIVLNNIDDIEITPDEVTFIERGTKVDFKTLSEGYRTTITWVCDLIQRLAKNQPYIASLHDFYGIVLIDEIDLHLHPIWEYKIVSTIRKWLPNIQFIMTTHSPLVILGSSKDAVFYKLYKSEGITHLSQPLRNIKNMMANTLVTSPLFNATTASAVNNDGNVDTSDDYLYSVIHKEIAQRIREDQSFTEQGILDEVIAAMDKLDD